MDKTAALKIAVAVAEAIRELGEVPSGHLYARLMDQMSLDTYNAIIGALKGAGLVKEQNYLLSWSGPAKGIAS
jgi:hypothetical protein